jgi:hypothetical protein
MAHLIQHLAAGEGKEFVSPDAVLTVKIDAAHTDGNYELFEVDAPRGLDDDGYDLGPGESIAIPPATLHTFTVLSPSVKFLAVSLTDGMGRFHADLDATVPHGRPMEENLAKVREVLARHEVTVEGMERVP